MTAVDSKNTNEAACGTVGLKSPQQCVEQNQNIALMHLNPDHSDRPYSGAASQETSYGENPPCS